MTSAPGTIPRHFDRASVRRNRARAAPCIADHAFLFDHATTLIEDRLRDVKRLFARTLQIGGRARAIDIPFSDITIMDCVEGLGAHVIGDCENLPFAPATFDLAISALDLHTLDDLPGALVQIRRALKPDGFFIAALPGGRTLHELRACMMQAELSVRGGVSPRIFPFADAQQKAALMQRAGFALPVVDSENITVTYTDAFRLMRDLRGMGEGNALASRDRRPPGKRMMMEAARLYAERHAEADGRIPATFELIFIAGWAPHASQQKPLRPGSAQIRLADALDTAEKGTGDFTKI